MKKRLKYIFIIGTIFILLIISIFWGRMAPNTVFNGHNNFIFLYFVDQSSNLPVKETRNISDINNIQSKIDFIFKEIKSPSISTNLSILRNVNILNYYFSFGNLDINLSSEYLELKPHEEIVLRTGLLHTFFNIENINSISLYVENYPLLNTNGEEIGRINRENIIMNPLLDVTVVRTIPYNIDFYFVMPDLSGLYRRSVYLEINENVNIEYQVLEHLLQLANSEDNLFLSQGTTILNINTIENISYVDFSSHFVDGLAGREPEKLLTIYAIVNTLTGLSQVDIVEVEFLIEGQRLIENNFYIDLSQSFFRNDNIDVFELIEYSGEENEIYVDDYDLEN
ncbi:MAG: GerMN domain-containing protein [Defluviitaleaceae bacterium]|nr:GerMN domain-containing protein [Defluviitaleaceae bacterium]